MKISELFIQEYLTKNNFVDWSFFKEGPFKMNVSPEEEQFFEEQFKLQKEAFDEKGTYDVSNLTIPKLIVTKYNKNVEIIKEKSQSTGFYIGTTSISNMTSNNAIMAMAKNYHYTETRPAIDGSSCFLKYRFRERVPFSKTNSFGVGGNHESFTIYIPELEYIE